MKNILSCVSGIASFFVLIWLIEKLVTFIMSIHFINNLATSNAIIAWIILFILLEFLYNTAYSISMSLMMLIGITRPYPIALYTIVIIVYLSLGIYVVATTSYLFRTPYYITMGTVMVWSIITLISTIKEFKQHRQSETDRISNLEKELEELKQSVSQQHPEVTNNTTEENNTFDNLWDAQLNEIMSEEIKLTDNIAQSDFIKSDVGYYQLFAIVHAATLFYFDLNYSNTSPFLDKSMVVEKLVLEEAQVEEEDCHALLKISSTIYANIVDLGKHLKSNSGDMESLFITCTTFAISLELGYDEGNQYVNSYIVTYLIALEKIDEIYNAYEAELIGINPQELREIKEDDRLVDIIKRYGSTDSQPLTD